jgi:hypothetical protein
VEKERTPAYFSDNSAELLHDISFSEGISKCIRISTTKGIQQRIVQWLRFFWLWFRTAQRCSGPSSRRWSTAATPSLPTS